MGVYVHFTDEQKRRANNVDLADFLERRGEKLIPSGRDKRLESDHSITIRGNEWFDHARGIGKGGCAIDFVQHYYNLSFPEAVQLLLGGEMGATYKTAEQKPAEPKKPFALPSANRDMRRVFAYLVKARLIDREVVTYFAKQNLIYESCEPSKDKSKEYHNAVFVGTDEHGIPRHAHKHGIYTVGKSFKGNVDGCDPRYSFHHIGTDNTLLVFEAPIDLLSYLTLHPTNWQTHSYVALCGVSDHAMQRTLELYPHLDHVLLCLDHDAAGIEAGEKYCDHLTSKVISCERVLPQHKDWNEDLKAALGLEATPAEDHPQHLLRDEICIAIAQMLRQPFTISASHQVLYNLLDQTLSHLQTGTFNAADTCLHEMMAISLRATAESIATTDRGQALSEVKLRLYNGFKTYENRGRLSSRLDLIDKELKNLRSLEISAFPDDPSKRMFCYEFIASHCLKAAILVQDQQPVQAPAMHMA